MRTPPKPYMAHAPRRRPPAAHWPSEMLSTYHRRSHLSPPPSLGGSADGNMKLLLALTWQLMRYHVIRFLTNLSAASPRAAGKRQLMTELDVVAWANATVADGVAAGLASSEPISTLREPSLCNGRFLLDLLRSVEPRAVEPNKVLAGATTGERVLNAKYAISCARKVGVMVFLLHEDIVEVRCKM